MQHGARLFAYTTWVVMISLAIIVFTNRFLEFITDPGWVGLVTILAFGFVYLNLSYISVKRFIRKVFEQTQLHYVLALLIFLPPGFWVGFISEEIEGSRLITIVVLAFSCGLGAYYGHRSGKRQQKQYIEKLRQKQQEKVD